MAILSGEEPSALHAVTLLGLSHSRSEVLFEDGADVEPVKG